jgi:hypothetical protein
MHNPMQIDGAASVAVGLCMDERPGEGRFARLHGCRRPNLPRRTV